MVARPRGGLTVLRPGRIFSKVHRKLQKLSGKRGLISRRRMIGFEWMAFSAILVDKSVRVKWPLGAGAVRVDTGKSLVRSEARHGCGREEGSWKNQPSTPHLERIGNRRANCPPREVEILPTVLYPQDPVWRDPRVSGRYGKGGRTLWSVEATVGLVACRRCVCDAAFWGLDRAFKPATGGLARPHGAQRLCTRSTMGEGVWGACISMAAMKWGG